MGKMLLTQQHDLSTHSLPVCVCSEASSLKMLLSYRDSCFRVNWESHDQPFENENTVQSAFDNFEATLRLLAQA